MKFPHFLKYAQISRGAGAQLRPIIHKTSQRAADKAPRTEPVERPAGRRAGERGAPRRAVKRCHYKKEGRRGRSGAVEQIGRRAGEGTARGPYGAVQVVKRARRRAEERGVQRLRRLKRDRGLHQPNRRLQKPPASPPEPE